MHHFATSRMRLTAALALVLAGGAEDLTAQASRHDQTRTHRKPPLVLERHGWFIAGGNLVQPTFDNLTRTRPVPPPLEERRMLVNEAYVEFFIPHKQRKHAIPIILAHSGRTGIIWLTTPDGREGWAHFFVRRGFPVYVVEPPGVGRAGFPVDQFNRVRAGLEDPASQPRLVHGDDSEWELFWIGPAPRELGDGTLYGNQMPTDERSYRHWLHAGSMPGGPVPGSNVPAFIALLEKVGPAIYVGWSGGGGLGQTLMVERPDLFRAFIGIESTGAGCITPDPDPAVVDAVTSNDIPFLNIVGGAQAVRDPALDPISGVLGEAEWCEPLVDAIVAAGGNATNLLLPDVGIFGNSHQMMSEKNSDEIARVLLEWIERNVEVGGGGKHGKGNVSARR